MRLNTLLLRSLWHHWRANVAVLLGSAVGTAVLAGALIVGDSLRGSLRDLTLDRLGDVRFALVSERFFRAELADEVQEELKGHPAVKGIAPAILLRGAVERRGSDGRLLGRAGRVQIAAVDERFWKLFGRHSPRQGDSGAVINHELADAVGAKAGDFLEAQFDRPQALPSDSIVGRQVDDSGLGVESGLRITQREVVEVLPLRGAGRFSLNAQQQKPLILYVPLSLVQSTLRESVSIRNSANVILVSTGDAAEAETAAVGRALSEALARLARPEDVGLTLRTDVSGRRYVSVESRRMLLEAAVVRAVQDLSREKGWQVRPTLTYLVNLLTDQSWFPLDLASAVAANAAVPDHVSALQLVLATSAYTPYLTVSVVDPSEPAPWGTFWYANGEAVREPPPDNTIYLNESAARDLRVHLNRAHYPRLHYFVEGDGWLLAERSATLTLGGVVALRGAAADPVLTPDFPGIKGKAVPSDWKPPFPRPQWHPGWFRASDELYWKEHQATPRGFVSLGTARALGWVSRHGEWTSIRVAVADPAESMDMFWAELKQKLPPDRLGLSFRDVRAEGLAASGSGTSRIFGWLFLGFSSFLILSAALLVGLLFRLGIERRSREIGLLFALGYPYRTVRRLLLAEGVVLAAAGSVLGLACAVGYAAMLIAGLNRAWAETMQTTFLRLHVAALDPMFGPLPYPSLALGLALGVGVALAAIVLGLSGLRQISPRALLAGQTTDETEAGFRAKAGMGRMSAGRWPITACLFLAAALASVSMFVSEAAAAPLFFGCGAALLAAGILAARRWLYHARGHAVHGSGMGALARLGLRNSSRNPARSSLTVGLLASATFLIVAVESFRKLPEAEAASPRSGTGGFIFVAEADVPLRPAPDSLEHWRALTPGRRAADQAAAWNTLAEAGFQVWSFPLRPGDDVSCLNLYEPQQPRVLGVPRRFLTVGRFQITGLENPTAAEQANPWLVLERDLGGEVPVLADNHAAQWVLQKNVGDRWTITSDAGTPVTLRLVGLVRDSIFQSELLISEEHFRRMFPSRDKYGFFLVDCRRDRAAAVRQVLEVHLGERYGMHIQSAAARLAEFQAVENMYLSTFQVLGGLGLLLGSLGLAVVLLRNVWERRGELALLRAIGYRPGTLGLLLFLENGALVLTGLGLGVAAALAAVTPHLVDAGRLTSFPWLGVAVLLGLVVGVGFLSGALAAVSSLRTPLLPALRQE